MRDRFDPRVLDATALKFIRECQRAVDCHLGGGAALSGAWLSHRLSRDIDLFCHDRTEHRELVHEIGHLAQSLGLGFTLLREGGGHVRGRLAAKDWTLEVDVVHEPAPDLEPPPALIEGVKVESLTDLRASKLTCLVSRAEPRDLVDVLWLERAGFNPESDLPLALEKDAGIDPGILAWLLRDFPTSPLPLMLEPLTEDELKAYRDDLAARFKKLSVT